MSLLKPVSTLMNTPSRRLTDRLLQLIYTRGYPIHIHVAIELEETETYSEVPLLLPDPGSIRVCLLRHFSRAKNVRQADNPTSETLQSDRYNIFECVATAYVTHGRNHGEYFAELPVPGKATPSFDFIKPNLQVSRWTCPKTYMLIIFQYFIVLVTATSDSGDFVKLKQLSFHRIEIRCWNDSSYGVTPFSIIPPEASLPGNPAVEGWLKMDSLAWASVFGGE